MEYRSRGQHAAEQLRELLERRLAARVYADDVAGVKAIFEVTDYGRDIASETVTRMTGETVEPAYREENELRTKVQQLTEERDALIQNAKHERDVLMRAYDAKDAALRDRNAVKEELASRAALLDGIRQDRDHAIAERDVLKLKLATESRKWVEHAAEVQRTSQRAGFEAGKLAPSNLGAKVTPQVSNGVESGNGQPAEVLGMVKVHSGDDIPEPTPPPKVRKSRKADKPTTDADKWGKAQYRKQTEPETGQKLYQGMGCAVHPTKKKQYKIQGEKDPDTKNVRAMVAKIRPEPVFPSVPEDIDKASQIVVPSGLVNRDDMVSIPSGFGSQHNDEYKAAARHNLEVSNAAKAEHRCKLSQGNLAAYKALKFWVHHKIKETRGLTAADRTAMYQEHGDAIREIALAVATEHGTTRDELGIWVSENINEQLGTMITQASNRVKTAA